MKHGNINQAGFLHYVFGAPTLKPQTFVALNYLSHFRAIYYLGVGNWLHPSEVSVLVFQDTKWLRNNALFPVSRRILDASGFLVLSKKSPKPPPQQNSIYQRVFCSLFTCKNPIFPLSQTAFTKVWNKRRKMNLVLNKHNVMYVHTSKKGKLWDHGEKEQTL